MSWDVFLQKFSRTYESLGEMSGDENPQPLGTRQAVQEAISSVFTSTDWSDPQWGNLLAEFGSVEFNIGARDPVQSVALHVRAGDAVIGGILELCRRLGCQAMDPEGGRFLDRSEVPETSLLQWQKYRDRVVGNREA